MAAPRKPAKPERARPMTQREYAEAIAKVSIERGRPRSSVKLSTGPRGQVMVDVIVHAGDEPGLDTAEQVAQKAMSLFNTLRGIYGITSGPMVQTTGGAATASNGDE